MSAAAKRLKTEETSAADATVAAKEGETSVASLTSLSARAVEQSLIDEYKTIPDEADDTIAERRRELHRQLNELNIEKYMYIGKREQELATKCEEALKHINSAGGCTKREYCTECDVFYNVQDGKDKRCIVEGCVKHISCPDCYPLNAYNDDDDDESGSDNESGSDDEQGVKFDETCYGGKDNFWYEQNKDGSDTPSTTGYANCWICEKEFCNHHFEEHYGKCRSRASKHCGFRPPTGENSYMRYVCVPDHCGKVISEDEKKYICYPEDGLCCTVCCVDCVYLCRSWYYGGRGRTQCKQAHCK